jgi:hypothetical protein
LNEERFAVGYKNCGPVLVGRLEPMLFFLTRENGPDIDRDVERINKPKPKVPIFYEIFLVSAIWLQGQVVALR